jgi:hypothetical protein
MNGMITIGSKITISSLVIEDGAFRIVGHDETGGAWAIWPMPAKATRMPQEAPAPVHAANHGEAPASLPGASQEATGASSAPGRARVTPDSAPGAIGAYLAENPDEVEKFALEMTRGRRLLVAEEIVRTLGPEVKSTAHYQRLIALDPSPEFGGWGDEMSTAVSILDANIQKVLQQEHLQRVTVDPVLCNVRVRPPAGDGLTAERASQLVKKWKG